MNALPKTPVQLAREQMKIERIDSVLEATFALQARAEKFPPWVRNFVFLPDRRLEIDFAWPDLKFGVEIHGGVHRVGTHLERDAEKIALALLAGWTILPVASRHVRSGRAIAWAKSLLWERRGLD